MNAVIKKFLEMVQKIKSLKPAYRQPGDGSDGTCDCIGLVIGAIRRMGLKWTGIHGTNWAARKEFVELKKINSINDLFLGEVLLKGCAPGTSRYALPVRYKKGGSYYNGDLTDYYHAGVVTSLNPLNITHMTSPTVKVDTKLGQWGYGGMLKILKNAGGGVEPTPTPAPMPSTGKTAIVTAPSGSTVKMRQYPSTSCRTYVNIPIGTKVTLVSPGEDWAQISYGTRKNWYMMAKFLEVC